MIAGKLDRRITIQRDSKTRDVVTGEVRKEWNVFANLWAGKESKSGMEKLQANKIISIGDEVFIVRYNEGIKTDMRINYNSQYYDIVSIQEIGRKEGLRIITQRVN